MKKLRIALTLLLIHSVASASMTKQQAQQASQAATQMAQTASQLVAYAAYMTNLLSNNWAYTVGFSTNTITLSAQQQSDIIANYQNLKNQLVTEYGQLP